VFEVSALLARSLDFPGHVPDSQNARDKADEGQSHHEHDVDFFLWIIGGAVDATLPTSSVYPTSFGNNQT
jgi:hypothetical protein